MHQLAFFLIFCFAWSNKALRTFHDDISSFAYVVHCHLDAMLIQFFTNNFFFFRFPILMKASFLTVCDELLLGIPYKAWWVGILVLLCLGLAFIIPQFLPPYLLQPNGSTKSLNQNVSKKSWYGCLRIIAFILLWCFLQLITTYKDVCVVMKFYIVSVLHFAFTVRP